MKNRCRHILFFMLISMIFSSCRLGNNYTIESDPGGISTVVTNIYAPEECDLPTGYTWLDDVTPFFDEYTGTLSLVSRCGTEVTAEDDSIYSQYTYSLLTYDSDGVLQSNFSLPVDSSVNIEVGIIKADEILWIEQREIGNYLVHRNLQSGEILTEKFFTDIFGEGTEYNFSMLLTDGEENIWMGNENMAVVLDGSNSLVEQFWFQDTISSLSCEDGRIYGCLDVQGSKYLVELQKDTGKIQEIAHLDMAALGVAFAAFTQENDSGYEFYYSTSDGIYGMFLNNDGNNAPELVLDYANSGIINYAELQLMGMDAGGTDFISVCSEDLMLFSKTLNMAGQWITTPVLYRTTEDIVLAEVQVIEFAHAIPLEDNIRANLINYDTQNRDVSVVTLDYSQYNTQDDPEAGAWRMVTDILNGIISPDIVYGYSNSTEILQMVEHKRYTDLMPFFEKDDSVNPETVFGCVQNAFTDDDGKLWALTPYFMLRTLLAATESLGNYAGDSILTVEEFLDFAQGYDTMMFDLTKEYAETNFYSVYETFYDTQNGTCTFDSPLFKRYLTFLLSLPAEAEYEAKSPLGQVTYADRYKYYMDGTVPFKEFNLEAPLQMRYDMGTPNTTLIGFPTNGTSGANLFSRMTFLMTDQAEDAAVCWDFIKGFMHTEYGMWVSGPGMTAMKEVFISNAYKNQGKLYRVYGNGNVYEDSEAAFYESIGMSDAMGNGTSYTIEEWHEPTVRYGIEYLDTEGMPLCNRLPNDVKNIIEEEFSALAAGHGTVDDCADKIQSRVSIWLAENVGR